MRQASPKDMVVGVIGRNANAKGNMQARGWSPCGWVSRPSAVFPPFIHFPALQPFSRPSDFPPFSRFAALQISRPLAVLPPFIHFPALQPFSRPSDFPPFSRSPALQSAAFAPSSCPTLQFSRHPVFPPSGVTFLCPQSAPLPLPPLSTSHPPHHLHTPGQLLRHRSVPRLSE